MNITSNLHGFPTLQELAIKAFAREVKKDAHLLKNIPEYLQEAVLNQSLIPSDWKWFVTQISKDEKVGVFHLTTKTYKDLSRLADEIKEEDFFLFSGQQQHYFNIVADVIDFKKDIFGVDVTSYGSGEKMLCQRTITLYTKEYEKQIPIATLEFPEKMRQTVRVSITALSVINENVAEEWSLEVYKCLPSVLIFYVNQLARKVLNGSTFYLSPSSLENDLRWAARSDNIDEIRSVLFNGVGSLF